TPGAGFTARAGGSISVDAPITTTGGAVSLYAGDPQPSPAPAQGSVYVGAAITTHGGNITIHSDKHNGEWTSVRIANDLDAGAGAVMVAGRQSVSVEGELVSIIGSSVTMQSSESDVYLYGTTISATGSVSLGGGGTQYLNISGSEI